MKVSEILSTSAKAFPSLEIVPPLRGLTKDELLESIAPFMEFKPKYINVTSHRDEFEFREEADGSFSRHLVRNRISETTVCAAIMSRYDVDVVPHLICGGNTVEEIESISYSEKYAAVVVENPSGNPYRVDVYSTDGKKAPGGSRGPRCLCRDYTPK